jgi:hypothetical protein
MSVTGFHAVPPVLPIAVQAFDAAVLAVAAAPAKYSVPPTTQEPVLEVASDGLRPRSPEIVVVTAEVIVVPAITEKLAAVPRFGAVAATTADTFIGPVKPKTNTTINVIIKTLLILSIYIYIFL